MTTTPDSRNDLKAKDDPAAKDGETAQAPASAKPAKAVLKPVPEIGGPQGPEPTRYGDWEREGRCVDF